MTRRRTCTVAVIGPDGSGKSSVTRRVAETLPVPVRRIYMGVNLESSDVMLPTTRLIARSQRARGVPREGTAPSPRPTGLPARMVRAAKDAVRTANWIAEEWYRQGVAAAARRRGELVLFDRHFFCDFYAYDVVPTHGPRPLSSRVHGFLLAHAYPKPDLVVYLDAPAEVLRERKPERSREVLERSRKDYLALRGVLEGFLVVDAARPLDDVAADVTAVIMRHVCVRPDSGVYPAMSAGRPMPAHTC